MSRELLAEIAKTRTADLLRKREFGGRLLDPIWRKFETSKVLF
jgi:hypothetical protein